MPYLPPFRSIALATLLAALAPPAAADEQLPAGEQPPASAPATPQAQREKAVTLDELVVEADLSGDEPSVRRVTQQEMREQGAETAAEALEQLPAVHAATGRRGERIFTMRGLSQRQVLVLMDGAPSYVPYDGQIDLGWVPVELIDHMTVIKGPASVLFGPNGLGGAVNIVTRRPGAGPFLSASAETGHGHANALSGLHSMTAGPVGYTVYAGLRRRDALPLSADFEPGPREDGILRENSDEETYHAGGSASIALGGTHELRVGATLIDGQRGVPVGLQELTPLYRRFTTWRAAGASVGHSASYASARLTVDEQLYLRLYDNLLDAYDDATYSSQDRPWAFHTWYRDRIFGGRVRARYRLDGAPWGATALRLWIGAEHDRHHREERGAKPNEPIARSLLTLAPEAEAFIGQRWSVLAALQLDLEVPGTTASGSLRSRTGLGPLVSARFDPLPELMTRLTVARRTRFPTLRDRFSTGGGTRVANPELGPEVAWHIALESAWRARPWLQLQASIFDTEIDGLIAFVSLGEGREQLQNIESARIAGTELAVELQPWRQLRLRAGYSLLGARRTDGAEERLEYRPAHRATGALVVTPLRWVELSTVARVIGPQHYRDLASDAWAQLGAQLRWDARLELRPWRHATVWLRADNLLDADHESKHGFPEPGRRLWVGLRVALERSPATPRASTPNPRSR